MPPDYEAQYLQAVELFEADKFDECMEAVRQNLADLTLPHYYRIKNLILIACATDDWHTGEKHRREAERRYIISTRQTADDDEVSQGALRELRESLDELALNLEEHEPEEIDEYLLYDFLSDSGEEEDESDEFEEEEEEEVIAPAAPLGDIHEPSATVEGAGSAEESHDTTTPATEVSEYPADTISATISSMLTPPPSRGVDATAAELDELHVSREGERSGATDIPGINVTQAPGVLETPATPTTPSGRSTPSFMQPTGSSTLRSAFGSLRRQNSKRQLQKK